MVLDYTGKIHSYDINDLEAEISEMMNQKSNENKEFKTLFSIFVLKAADKHKFVSFNYIYNLASSRNVKEVLSAFNNREPFELKDNETKELVMK